MGKAKESKKDKRPKEILDVSKAYAILDRAILQGFDYIGVSIGGHQFVLKTLTLEEEDAVRIRAFGVGNRSLAAAWLLVYGTHSIDGQEYLGRRSEEVLRELYEFYIQMPAHMVSDLYTPLMKLTKRLDKATSLYQGYLYSTMSRMRWTAFKYSAANWGTYKTSAGTSLIRELWVRGNSLLDVEESEEKAWDHSIFVASAFNPKGIKDASVRRKSRRELVDEERAEAAKYGSLENRDATLNIIRGIKEQWSAPLKTQQDVVDELHRQIRGEKDKHDLFVEQYFNAVAARKKAEAEIEAARLAEVRKLRLAQKVEVFEGSREATPEELAQAGIVAKKHAKKVGVRRISRS